MWSDRDGHTMGIRFYLSSLCHQRFYPAAQKAKCLTGKLHEFAINITSDNIIVAQVFYGPAILLIEYNKLFDVDLYSVY